MIPNVLMRLALEFGMLSLAAVGGVNAIIPEIQRRAVEVQGWLSNADFAQAFAIAQAAPGPNLLVVSVIGWKAAGIAGALVATVAICGPSSVLTYGVSRIWDRFREAPLRIAIQEGLAPVTVGLVLAAGFVLARTVDEGPGAVALTVLSAAAVLAMRIHPLWLLALGAAAGAAGWL